MTVPSWLVDRVDWDESVLGLGSTWPEALTSALDLIEHSGFPMLLLWGPERVVLYNAGFAAVLGAHHPRALGRPVRELSADLWEALAPAIDRVAEGGAAVTLPDLLLPVLHGGEPEERYFTWTIGPLVTDGAIAGFLCTIVETSRRVVAERRLRTLHDLQARVFAADDVEDVCCAAGASLGRNSVDVPFSRLYLFDDDDTLRLAGSSGPEVVDEHWPVEAAVRRREAPVVRSPIAAAVTLGAPVAVTSAVVMPIVPPGRDAGPLGAMVLGLSPFTKLDDDHRRFLDLAVSHIAAAITHARAARRERFLGEVSSALASTLEVGEVLRKITEFCVPTFADWCQVQALGAEDRPVIEAVRHRDPELAAFLERLVGRPVISPQAGFGSPEVLRTAQTRRLDHAETLRAVRENVPDPADREIYERAGLGSALIVPLVARSQTLGTLHLVNVEERRHSESAVEVAEELARRAALAIENSRLYQREHRVATTLQQAMLPTDVPTVDGLEFSAAYRPAEREAQVGGDWYDAFAVGEGRVAISIGDVAGHGLAAAVAMSEARQALRLSGLDGLPPAEALRRANNALMIGANRPMITAIFGIIDVTRATFTYACAGHPPPALATLAGEARFLAHGGIPMGVLSGITFPTRTVALEPYATLLLYTDGLIEFRRDMETESGRLLRALAEKVPDTREDHAGALLAHLLNAPQVDDIAMLLATVVPRPAAPLTVTLPAARTSAAIARRIAGRFADAAGLPAERAIDLSIAIGEAAANAIEHAYAAGDGSFVLRLAQDGSAIAGEVRDFGRWQAHHRSPYRGRGLAILRAVTDRLELDGTPRGTTVSFEIAGVR